MNQATKLREEAPNPREEPSSPREEATSPREEPRIPREKVPGPREEISSRREEPPNPREELIGPREKMTDTPRQENPKQEEAEELAASREFLDQKNAVDETATFDVEHKDVNSELEKKVGGLRKELRSPREAMERPRPQHPAPALVRHQGAAHQGAPQGRPWDKGCELRDDQGVSKGHQDVQGAAHQGVPQDRRAAPGVAQGRRPAPGAA